MHSFAAENYALVGRLFGNLLELDEALWPAAASALEWFSFEPLLERVSHIEFGRGNRISARMVQYRISIGLGDAATASRVVELFDTEESYDGVDTAVARFAFYSGVIRESLSAYAFDSIASFYLRWANAGERLPQEMAIDLTGLEVLGPSGHVDLVTIAGMVACAKVTGSTALAELNKFLESLEPENARRFLWWAEAPDACAEWARLLFEGELSRQEPDWQTMFTAFQSVAALVEKLGLLKGFSTVVPIAARIRAQELGDIPGALVLVDQILANSNAPSIVAVKAELLQRVGRHGEVRLLLADALPRWELLENDVSPAFAYRVAAISAAALDKIDDAAALLGEAASVVRRAVALDKSRLGLFARYNVDAARCTLEAGDLRSTMELCDSAIGALLEVDDETLSRSMGRTMYVILFVLKVRFGAAKIGEVDVGWASTPNAIVSDLADPNASREMLRYVAAKLEVALLGTEERLTELLATFDALHSSAVRSLVGFAWLRRAIRVEPESFAATVMTVIETLGRKALGGADLAEIQQGYIKTAWLMLLASRTAKKIELERWRSDANAGKVGAMLADFFAIAADGLEGNIEPLDGLRGSSWDLRCISAAMLDSSQVSEPKALLQSHWILVRMLAHVPDVNFGVALILEKMQADWQLKEQLLDRETRISLRDALGEDGSVWNRMLRILEIVGASVHWEVPADYIAITESLKAASPVLL
jgi:hypothetical protein